MATVRRNKLKEANKKHNDYIVVEDNNPSMVDHISNSDGKLTDETGKEETNKEPSKEIPPAVEEVKVKEAEVSTPEQAEEKEEPAKEEPVSEEAAPKEEKKKSPPKQTGSEKKGKNAPVRINDKPAGRVAHKAAMKKDAQLCIILDKDLLDKMVKCHRMQPSPCSFNEYLFKIMEEEMHVYEKAKNNMNSLEKYGKECLKIIEDDSAANSAEKEKKSFTVRVTSEVKGFIDEFAWSLYVNKADIFRMVFIKDCKRKLGED